MQKGRLRMKIEKVNENQIRCTLTREDLVSRQLKISELAYGTEKAKNLFRDMMQQANFEFGFEAEDIPLMIEAIPLNAECIVLIITKVEDPEELDTRFSRFAPSVHENEDEDFMDANEDSDDNSDEVMDLFRRLHETRKSAVPEANPLASKVPNHTNYTRIFSFDSLHLIISVAGLLKNRYNESNSLYKEEHTSKYLLVLTRGSMTIEDFNKTSNLITEYGNLQKSMGASTTYLAEHYDPIIENNALQSLSEI